MQIIHELEHQLDYLKSRKDSLEKAIKKYPHGKLIRKLVNGKTYYYIQHKNKKVESLYKKPTMVKQLKHRDQLKYLHESVTHDIPLLEKFIASYEPIPHNTFKNVTLANNQNNYKSESAKHVYNDIYFRSKSELNFAQMLSSYNIEFCYEPALTLKDGRTIYPDFIVTRLSDGKMIIVEYFGMMDDDYYRANALKKIEDYHQNGYYMWDNFIAIFEYKNTPINLDSLNKIVSTFLL